MTSTCIAECSQLYQSILQSYTGVELDRHGDHIVRDTAGCRCSERQPDRFRRSERPCVSVSGDSCMQLTSKCSADCSSLHCRRVMQPPPPPTPTHAWWPLILLSIHRHRHTRGSSRSTVDAAVGEETCVQLLRRLQLSPLPATDATAASTETDTRVVAVDLLSIHRHQHTRGSSRSTVDTAVGEESCV